MAPAQFYMKSLAATNATATLPSNMTAPITADCGMPGHHICAAEVVGLPCSAKADSSRCSGSAESVIVRPSIADYTDNDNATSAASSGSLMRRNIGHPDIAGLAVNAHNAVRARHGAPPLRWSPDLANSAQAQADLCILAHNTVIGAETGGYGQNIASWGTNGVEPRTIDQLVVDGVEQQWYHGEIAKYPGYGQAQPDMASFHNWGHFSQAVWAGTSEVGCGIQACPVNTLFPGLGMTGHVMFCNYRAPGNAPGKYADNVKAPTS